MKTKLFFISFFLFSNFIFSQTPIEPQFEWAAGFGGSSDDNGKSIVIDVNGNVYLTGFFESNTIDFNPDSIDTYYLSSNYNYNIYISKLDKYGNFVWAKTIGGNSVQSYSIYLDPTGNVCVIGRLSGTVDFNPHIYGTYDLTSNGTFLWSLDSMGIFVSATILYESNTTPTFDNFGNIYLQGGFTGTVDFDPGIGIYSLTAIGIWDIFLLKLNPFGNFIWVKTIGSNMSYYSKTYDTSGNMYFTGFFNGTVDFDPGIGVYNLISNGMNDIFILKLDSYGNFVWAKSFGDIDNDIGKSITVDDEGNVYTIGSFEGTVDFAPSPYWTFNLYSIGADNVFISKLDSSGNFVWAKNFGCEFSSTIDIDEYGSIYIYGAYYDTIDLNLDPNGTFTINPNGQGDFFINKLDTSGSFIWAKSFGGNGIDGISGNLYFHEESFYLTGYFSNIVDFDPGNGMYNLSSNGYQDAFILKLSQPQPLIASINQNNIICNSNSSGNATIIAVGGLQPYLFQWSTGDSIASIDSLSAGWYFVTVSDANGDVLLDSVEITEPPLLKFDTAISVNILCNSNASGSIDISTVGGTSPYYFTWSNGATTEDLTNLSAENYYLTIIDANSCELNDSFIIIEPNALSLILLGDEYICYGESTDLSSFISGGISPYSFEWSNGVSSQNNPNIIAGTYSLLVSDSNSCTISSSFTINESTAFSISENIIDASCYNQTDGEINLAIGGGTFGALPISTNYYWNTSETTQDITNLIQGNYSVSITNMLLLDSTICAIADTFTINQPDSLVVDLLNLINVDCHGNFTGEIDISVSGGTIPYNYFWSNLNTTEDNVNVAAGTFFVTIVDNNACEVSDSFTVGEPSEIETEIFGDIYICNSATTSLSVFANGGTPPYSYNWLNSATSSTISNLSGGTYGVMVIDGNSCSKYTSEVVYVNTPINISGIVEDVSCFNGNNGIIDISVTGGDFDGMPTLTNYQWSNSETSEDITGLYSGVYSVTVFNEMTIDGTFCSANASFTVEQPDEMITIFNSSNASCQGCNDGAIDLFISGGASPYSFLWSNGEISEDIAYLPSGVYTVTVSDSSNCSIVDSIEIFELIISNTPNWSYLFSPTNHSILIQNTIEVIIEGAPIEAGDFIGVFYDSLGTLACGGYQIWNGVSTTITAWGEDIGNDGFILGEEFKWKIWDASENVAYNAIALYMPTPPMSNQEYFSVNGLSGLTSLSTNEIQAITLPQGWSFFSSYIIPTYSAFDSIFSELINNIEIVKNTLGEIYWPVYVVNQIGDISICEGYQIKMIITDTLIMSGLSVQPQNTICNLQSGWSYISYLRKTSASISILLSSIVNDVEIVKNYMGQTYWPLYGVNLIGNMNPGEGYQIKMNNATTLTYPPNSANISKSNIQISQPKHFKTAINTGSNMTLGIPKTAWETEPPIDSEIGIYSSEGLLVGSSVFTSENLAISIWGDDELTEEIDGLIENEIFVIKIWNDNSETFLKVKNWL
ncbi:MAG: hypothetical protein HOA61_02760, partial [Bacteroidetes bacterium]|nr:hypothetical protein [Bacteroidota bacterium]